MGFKFVKTTMMFPTPLVEYKIADAERLNTAMLEEIAVRQQDEEGVVRSNRSGWHSAGDFFRRREPAHAELSAAIKQAVGHATASISQAPDIGKVKLQLSGWINVNPTGGYNVPHDHPGSFWSGCYYIQVPEGSGRNEDGAISFIDHRSAPAGQALIKAGALVGFHARRPDPGTLLLFPSGQRHWVYPNPGPEDRVTMAFNATAKLPEG